jgi:hypothetical protein
VSLLQALVLLALSVGAIAVATALREAVRGKACQHTAAIAAIGEGGGGSGCGETASTARFMSQSAFGPGGPPASAAKVQPASREKRYFGREGFKARLKRLGRGRSENVEDRRAFATPFVRPDGASPEVLAGAFHDWINRSTFDGQSLSRQAFAAVHDTYDALDDAERAAIELEATMFERAVLWSKTFEEALVQLE